MTSADPTLAFLRFRKTGDPGALGVVFDATAAELLRVASHLVPDLNAAEDLVQSTFLAAIENRERFAAGSALLPWLVGILTNHAHRHRTRAARRPDPSRVNQSAPRTPDESAAGRELSAAVSAAIEQLPETYRPVLRLHLRHGFGPQEIALDLGRAPATVRKQLQRGLERLRRSLPAGVAGLVVVQGQGPARGLESIRETMLSQVSDLAPVALTVGGMFIVKKTAVFLTSIVLLVAIWSFAGYGSEPETDQVRVADTTELQADGARDSDETPRAGEQRSSIDAAESESTEESTLDGQTLTVQGSVRSGLGKPVASASIFLSTRYSMGEGEVVRRSDEEGLFVIAGVEPGRHVAAFADGWTPCAAEMVEGDPGTVQRVTLELKYGAARVRGRVLGPDRNPVAGARIMIGYLENAGGWSGSKRWASPPPIWLVSDDEGRFETKSAPSRAPIYVCAEGLAHWNGKLDKTLDSEIEVHLQRGGVLEGSVLDGAGGGVEGAWVYAGAFKTQRPPWHQQHTRTDERGRFRILGVPAGARAVKVRHEGYRTVKEELSFTDGAVTAWYAILRKTATIQGRVVDEKGAGLAGYKVRASGIGNGHSPRPVKTSEDGSFELKGCEDESYTVSIYDPEDWGHYSLARRPGVVPGGAAYVIQLDLARRTLGSASGVIYLADGRPAGSVSLTLWREPYGSGKNLQSEAHTGRVQLDHLPAANYRLDVRAPGYARFQKHFAVKSGVEEKLGEIRLPEPCFIVVKARRLDGGPVKNGFVSVIGPAKALQVDYVHVKDGIGRCGPLPGGRYTLKSGMGWLPRVEQEIDVEPGAENVFHFDPGVCAPVTFRYLPVEKRDLNLRIVWRDAAGRELQSLEGMRWRKKYEAKSTRCFAPGTYKLEVIDKSGLRGETEVTIRRGDGARTVDVALKQTKPVKIP